MKPLVDADGTSRKSVVDPGAVARGGGHLCLWELHVFIGAVAERTMVTSGLTLHGGRPHVYVREFPEKLSAKDVRDIFENAANMLEDIAGAPPAPPPPPPRQLSAAVPPPPADDFVATHPSHGSTYGTECLKLEPGETIRMLPPPEQAFGWSYGEMKDTRRRGWFPPKFVEPDNTEWFWRMVP